MKPGSALVLRSDLTMRPRYARPGHETADGLLPPLPHRCSLRAANCGRQIPRTRGRVRAPKRGGSTAFLPVDLAAERVHVHVGAVAAIAHRAGTGHALAMNAEREMQGDDFALAPITFAAMISGPRSPTAGPILSGTSPRLLLAGAVQHSFECPHGDTQQSADLIVGI
jgi:hypothetical protein